MSIKNEDRPAYPTPFLERSEGANRAHSFLTDLGEYEPQLLGFSKFERASLAVLAGLAANPKGWDLTDTSLAQISMEMTKELFKQWREEEEKDV